MSFGQGILVKIKMYSNTTVKILFFLEDKLADKEYRQLSASSARFPADASKDNSGSNKDSLNNSSTSEWSLPINTVFHSSV